MKAVSLLFWIAAAYDGVLGLAFLFAHARVFEWGGAVLPNHPGYVQFSAALLIVFALMFASIARDPIGNRRLILYGILLKVSYCSVVFYYWMSTGISTMWKPFAILDIAFLVLFFWAKATLSRRSGTRETV